jgi:hypothetical protein
VCVCALAAESAQKIIFLSSLFTRHTANGLSSGREIVVCDPKKYFFFLFIYTHFFAVTKDVFDTRRKKYRKRERKTINETKVVNGRKEFGV